MDPKNRFRYKITNRLGAMFVEPLGESDFKIEWTREDENKLMYERTLPSKVVFVNEAYNQLLKLERSNYRCEFINVTIERSCKPQGGTVETWLPWFGGRISLNEGSWDLDRCHVEIQFDEEKADDCYNEKKSVAINLLDAVPVASRRLVKLYRGNIVIEKVEFERNVTTAHNNQICPAPNYWAGVGLPGVMGWVPYDVLASRFDSPGFFTRCINVAKWARQTMTLADSDPSPGVGWFNVGGAPAGFIKWARPAALYDCEEETTDDGFLKAYKKTCKILGENGTISQVDNGMPLEAVLNSFVNIHCPGKVVVSDFFQINPVFPSSINYVTGLKSKVNFLTLFQKSDVKRPGASGNATKAEMTWEQLLTALVETFNVRWSFTGNIFRIEHISFYSQGNGFDLTLPKYADYVRNLRRYSYATEVIPQREEFKFMEASTGDFKGVPIIYSGACVSQSSRGQIKTHTVENLTTDVELCISNPDSRSSVVDDKGFVLMAPERVETSPGVFEFFIISEPGILEPGTKINNPLAWAQLHRDYHKFYRPLRVGNMNNAETTFFSVRPTKKGDTLTIPYCCDDDFNPLDKIKTPLGVGIVSKASFSFKDQTVALDILYSSEDELITNVTPVANNDMAETPINTAVIINVLANDYDPDGVFIGILIIIQPQNGTLTINPDNTVTYTPNPGYYGDDQFIYVALDNYNQPSNNALVLIIVKPLPGPAQAIPDAYQAQYNTALSVPAPGVMANDNGAGITVTAYNSTTAMGGTVSMNPDGSFIYTPAPNYVGNDSFNYTIADGNGLTSSTIVEISVKKPTIYIRVKTQQVQSTVETTECNAAQKKVYERRGHMVTYHFYSDPAGTVALNIFPWTGFPINSRKVVFDHLSNNTTYAPRTDTAGDPQFFFTAQRFLENETIYIFQSPGCDPTVTEEKTTTFEMLPSLNNDYIAIN